MSLFLLTFFFLYSLLHLYIFLKIRGAFSVGTGITIVLILFMAVMVSAPILVRVSERHGWEHFARLISSIGYTWLGLVFLFCTCSLAVDIYRLFISALEIILRINLSSITPAPRLVFFIPLLYAAAAASYGFFEARAIRSELVVIKTPKVPKNVGTFTVVQISDVHLGLIVREGRLKGILRVVKQAQPDILVSTGDLVDGEIDNLEKLAMLLKDVHPPYGKFAVTGNHEFYVGIDQALRFTEKAGFTMLRGKVREVGGFMTIVGVDDPAGKYFGLFHGPSEQILCAGLPPERFTLLLKHRPAVDEEALGLFDLQLSGHTHNGQIFPFTLFVKLVFPYDAGLAHLPQGPKGYLRRSLLYVSRGTGTWGPPIRFLAAPEVTIITLVHADR
jgi:predicted MPP superfamily phosphohydrolase